SKLNKCSRCDAPLIRKCSTEIDTNVVDALHLGTKVPSGRPPLYLTTESVIAKGASHRPHLYLA
ncbi:MAG: hypothetical protein AAF960_29945, partial [Bacteroidota bacterium]